MATENNDDVVKLGFLEENDHRLLRSHFFPSKVGGRPSWLSLNPLPEPKDLECSGCHGTLRFLMQVYAPLQLREDTFHRTLFVFLCSNPSCSAPNDNKCFKVFRTQLPLVNEYYSTEPPNEDLLDEEDVCDFPSAENFNTLCNVCGSKGPKKCSKCKKVFYCSRDHQVADWKAGHKSECSEVTENSVLSNRRTISSIVFKEIELVTEDELFENEESGKDKSEKDEEERMKEYDRLMQLPQLKGIEGKFETEELEQSATAETEDDKQFKKFKKRIKPEPTQVLRYLRGGEPLWISAFHKSTESDIPNCECGAQRIFEFQIMPQLLSHLGLDSLDTSVDWGTVCIYTCADSCSIGYEYREEFVWKQDICAENAS